VQIPVSSPAPKPDLGGAINNLAGFLVRADDILGPAAGTNHEIAQNTVDAPAEDPEDDEVEVEKYDDPARSPRERHSRRCINCHHPDRGGIEEHFLN
jgi:hypothetical protein